jgi:hypothetical protein
VLHEDRTAGAQAAATSIVIRAAAATKPAGARGPAGVDAAATTAEATGPAGFARSGRDIGTGLTAATAEATVPARPVDAPAAAAAKSALPGTLTHFVRAAAVDPATGADESAIALGRWCGRATAAVGTARESLIRAAGVGADDDPRA